MSEEFKNIEKAEEIAIDYAKRRFEASKINIVSIELTEAVGIPIYKVVGDVILTITGITGKGTGEREGQRFSAQIDAKTGKILGFAKEP
jgi:uncharacterized membrane protein YkoI